MKIADYGKAITSYIESPTTAQKLQTKDKAQKMGRVFLSEGTDIVPPRKPKQLKDLYEKINRTVIGIRSNSFAPELLLPNLEKVTREYIKDGLISGADARQFAIERKQYWDKWIKDNPGGTVPVFDFDNDGNAIEVSDEEIIERLNEANGGRVGLQSGTDFDYRPGMPMDPLDPQRKISEVMDAYDKYYRGPGKKRRKIPFRRFFEIYAKENFADGGRVGFGEGTKIKLVEFIEKFKLENNRLPTIMEVADGAKSSTASIKKYLDEGVDFIKTDLSEVGKKGGDVTGAKKKTGVTKLDKKAYKELQDLRIKGVSFQVDKGVGGSTGVRITIQNPEVRNAFLKGNKTFSVTADAKGINQLKNLVEQIAVSDVYADNVLPFQTDEYKLKIRRLKDKMYKQKDPFRIYEKLSDYKSKIFPEGMAKKIQIQHGDAKFTAQTLSRMGLIDAAANISPAVERAERLRNNALKIAMATLDNPNASVSAKKAAADKYNSIAKGLRGQLKGTPGQGLVNFQLLDVDDSGKYKKLKDISFDPKKGLVDSDLDLSKITKEQADDLIAQGKKKLDIEAIKLKTGVKTADKIERPEKAKLSDAFKKFGKYAGQIAKPAIKVGSRVVGPFVPVVGTAGMVMGGADVAKAIEQGFTSPDEIALAYLAGPKAAEGLDSLKEKLRGREDETEDLVP
jgi:hypothetical protein